jgi:hypothetical protein
MTIDTQWIEKAGIASGLARRIRRPCATRCENRLQAPSGGAFVMAESRHVYQVCMRRVSSHTGDSSSVRMLSAYPFFLSIGLSKHRRFRHEGTYTTSHLIAKIRLIKDYCVTLKNTDSFIIRHTIPKSFPHDGALNNAAAAHAACTIRPRLAGSPRMPRRTASAALCSVE